MQLFDVKDNGNVSPSKDPQGHLLDKNVLRIVAEYGKIAEEFGVDEAILKDKIDESLVELELSKLAKMYYFRRSWNQPEIFVLDLIWIRKS